MSGLSIRNAELTDAEDIARLEALYIDCSWTKDQVRSEIESASVFFAATVDGKLVGYISGVCAADECEIANIAVDKDYRRLGIGSKLMESLEAKAKECGANFLFLLVRTDNVPAIELYKKFGFVTVGRRREYYGEADALIMRKNVK